MEWTQKKSVLPLGKFLCIIDTKKVGFGYE